MMLGMITILSVSSALAIPTKAALDHSYLHSEDKNMAWCFEASSGSKFASKIFTGPGKCPSSYSITEKSATVLQCPDGVTPVRECSPINVTITTKGKTLQRLQSLVETKVDCTVNDTAWPCIPGNGSKCIPNGCPCVHGWDCRSGSCDAGTCKKNPMGSGNGKPGCVAEKLLLEPYCLNIGASPPIQPWCQHDFDYSCPGVICCGAGEPGTKHFNCDTPGPKEFCVCGGNCSPPTAAPTTTAGN